MTQKTGMIAELGEEALLLPTLVEEALVANEQAKYYISLLQAGREQAERTGVTGRLLNAEREAAGIEDVSLDEAVPGAVLGADGRYLIPHLDRILAGAQSAIDAMIRPFAARSGHEADRFRRRRDALAPLFRPRGCSGIDRAGIAAIASGDPSAGDSPHLLVIDLHRALTGLVEGMACEEVDGARSYLLDPGDRALVQAFMRGLNRTADLRFGHPGLGTTAIRAGNRLLVQNEIGVTGAHVLVVSVAGGAITVTCTDVHAERLAFFRSLFEGWKVVWSETISRPAPGTAGGGIYHIMVGRIAAPGADVCAAFLEHLGSRIVFLIDWNKARKQLRIFLSNQDAVAVLRWAAENGVGHRAFLELGGADLVDQALDLAGDTETVLCLLGRDGAVASLKEALAVASDGLLRGVPRPALRDRCRAELVAAIAAAQADLLDACAAHAALVVEAARLLADSVAALRSAGRERVLENAAYAGRHEREADMLASGVIARCSCADGGPAALIAPQEQALDALAEGCFFAARPVAAALPTEEMEAIAEMAENAVAVACAHLGALQSAQSGGDGRSGAGRAVAFAADRGNVAADSQGELPAAIARALAALADAAPLLPPGVASRKP